MVLIVFPLFVWLSISLGREGWLSTVGRGSCRHCGRQGFLSALSAFLSAGASCVAPVALVGIMVGRSVLWRSVGVPVGIVVGRGSCRPCRQDSRRRGHCGPCRRSCRRDMAGASCGCLVGIPVGRSVLCRSCRPCGVPVVVLDTDGGSVVFLVLSAGCPVLVMTKCRAFSRAGWSAECPVSLF